MKKKIKILSINKRDYRSEFIFSKEQKVFKIIIEFLSRLGFTDDDEAFNHIGKRWDKEHQLYEDEIKNYNDRIDNFSNKNYAVDVIFFSKKVVLILNYKKDKQKEIAKALEGLIYE